MEVTESSVRATLGGATGPPGTCPKGGTAGHTSPLRGQVPRCPAPLPGSWVLLPLLAVAAVAGGTAGVPPKAQAWPLSPTGGSGRRGREQGGVRTHPSSSKHSPGPGLLTPVLGGGQWGRQARPSSPLLSGSAWSAHPALQPLTQQPRALTGWKAGQRA